MKKKFLVITLILAMISSMCIFATSCGSKADDENTLTLWIHNDEDTWTESYQSIVDAYMEEHPDVTINIESFPYDEYETKIQTAMMSDEGGADIYELWGGWGVDFAPSGSLAALPEEMEAEVREAAYPSTYGALEYEGKLYGIPQEFNIECGGLLVNNNVLKENDLEVPTTWSELVEAGKAGTKTEKDEVTVKGFDFVNWDGVMYLWTSMILSQGGSYLNEDGTAVDFNTPEAIKAWDELAAMATADSENRTTTLSGLDDGSDVEGYQELYALAAGGETGAMMVPRGPWCIAEGINDYDLKYGKDFSYVAMPFYGSQQAFAAETGWSMGVSSKISEEKQALAFDFLEYFFSDDVIMSHNLACGTIPAKKSVAQSEDYVKQFEYAEPLVGILDGGQFIGLFNTDTFKETVNNVFSAYCKGEYDSTEAAMTALTNKCNKKLFG